MTKMDMIWIAVASLIAPNTLSSRTVTRQAIQARVAELFGESVTPVVIDRHLVSSVDRQADRAIPTRGGSRNRYLFRTIDGVSPSDRGNFRLYKTADARHDGHEKTGKTLPEVAAVSVEHQHYLDWYVTYYINAGH
jgi:uncharacterized membrane protein